MHCCGFGLFPCGLIGSLHVRSVVVVVRPIARRFASEGAVPDGALLEDRQQQEQELREERERRDAELYVERERREREIAEEHRRHEEEMRLLRALVESSRREERPTTGKQGLDGIKLTNCLMGMILSLSSQFLSALWQVKRYQRSGGRS